MIKNRFGFTLVEALITLGIIGVIAGLTIPSAIAGRMATQARAQFDTAYAILNQTVADMISDGVDLVGGRFIRARGSMYEQFKSYMRVSIDCGQAKAETVKACSGGQTTNGYETFTGRPGANVNWLIDDGSFVLHNGMLVGFENPEAGFGYPSISIDINGKTKPPNRWGWDMFTFQLMGEDLLPVGAAGTRHAEDAGNAEFSFGANPDKWCDVNNISTATTSDKFNGITCAYKALEDEDYFKKIYRGR